MRTPSGLPKYRQVHDALEREIRSGRLRQGERLPSEHQLVRQFGTSRITVGRAVRELQRGGLVERRAGSGTYVAPRTADGRALAFGALFPNLGEVEVFEPICRGIMASPLASPHALVFASAGDPGIARETRAWTLCEQYIARRVAGVFFAPLEHTPGAAAVNQRIVAALDAARIAVVLIDRSLSPYPERGPYDLVGLDNRRAGYTVAEHLMAQGARRLLFVSLPESATSVDARRAGVREALDAAGIASGAELAASIDPLDRAGVAALLADRRPDAIVCANDRTAALLMRTLLDLGQAIPGTVRLVGFDDVVYAGMVSVPLTTVRQPCHEIGVAAMAAMIERLAHPALPAREILITGTLVVRQSG